MRILKTVAFSGAMLLAASTFAQSADPYGKAGTTGSSMGSDSTTNGLNTGIAPGPENGTAQPGYGAAARGSSSGMSDTGGGASGGYGGAATGADSSSGASGNSGTADSYGTGASGTSTSPADPGAGMGSQSGSDDSMHSGMSGTTDSSSADSSGSSDTSVTVASGGPGEAQRQAAILALYGNQPYQSHIVPSMQSGDLPDFGALSNSDNTGALGGYRH